MVKVLQSLRSLTGIENSERVTNRTSEEEKEKQKAFEKRISKAIVERRGWKVDVQLDLASKKVEQD